MPERLSRSSALTMAEATILENPPKRRRQTPIPPQDGRILAGQLDASNKVR